MNIAQFFRNNLFRIFIVIAFILKKHDGRDLPESDRYSECLLRLPFYYDLEIDDNYLSLIKISI